MFNIKMQTFTLFCFFVLSSKLFYLTLCELNLYFVCLFFFSPLCQCIQFQGPEFFNSLSREIQNSESVGLFGKDLKSSFFLSHIYIALFAELHTFSLLFFNLLINYFSLSTLNSHGVSYILRKPILPQPQASTLYSCRVQRKSFLQLAIRAR